MTFYLDQRLGELRYLDIILAQHSNPRLLDVHVPVYIVLLYEYNQMQRPRVHKVLFVFCHPKTLVVVSIVIFS
jgi:hypothetical protein